MNWRWAEFDRANINGASFFPALVALGETEDAVRCHACHSEERVWRRPCQVWDVWHDRGQTCFGSLVCYFNTVACSGRCSARAHRKKKKRASCFDCNTRRTSACSATSIMCRPARAPPRSHWLSKSSNESKSVRWELTVVSTVSRPSVPIITCLLWLFFFSGPR